MTMYLTRPDGNRSAMRLTQTAGTVQNGEWKTSWQIPGNIGSTQQTYGIQVAVYDVAGNMVTSQTLPVQVQARAPVQMQKPAKLSQPYMPVYPQIKK